MVMAKTELKVTVGTRSKVILSSGFKGYDACLNTYVGCQMGCAYCYVRFFVKDEHEQWGDFVRVRSHIEDRLPRELEKGYFTFPDGKNEEGDKKTKTIKSEDLRLVIGTMTDVYQPIERKHRITRTALQILANAKPRFNKIGIFTRSPIVLDDIDLITQLPRKRVHYTVTPLNNELMKLIEPIAIRTDRRFETIGKLKEAGVRCHVNVAPAIPTISEQFTDQYAQKLAELKVDEFFVDPMQAYGESWEALKTSLQCRPEWQGIEEIMGEKQAYREWKELYRARWYEAWARVRHLSPKTLPIWSDHIHHTWQNMNTGEDMDIERYGDDLE
jgi:DNA repair photolyase